ncbi:MAG TPA: hypothetical protein PLE54_10030 [Burkholderiaceae bacterium]|nr:hypothetical protein [Burkholderiaceae bacterium]HQR70929.1 hypothetical protein [Burkholderiaceae bacterium]
MQVIEQTVAMRWRHAEKRECADGVKRVGQIRLVEVLTAVKAESALRALPALQIPTGTMQR